MCLGSLGVLQCSAVAQIAQNGKSSLGATVGLAAHDSLLCCEKPVPNKMLRLPSEGKDGEDEIVGEGKDADDEDDAEPAHAQPADVAVPEGEVDDELGILRVRSQPVGIDSELGILRIRPTDDAPLEVEPEPTRQTSVFLTGRANVYGGNNLFRTPNPIDDRIYQTGIGLFAFPRLTDKTNLVLSAEANLARYEDLSVVDYDEIQFQAGIRQRLGTRSYGQLNWRYQDLTTPGSDSFFTANYVELLLSRRDILNNRTWVDAYYQARLSYSDPEEFSRFSQIATGSLNYGFDPQTRVSLLYQLFLDDYTQVSRHDTYHQVLAQFSHDLSSTTRLSVFTGLRFGRSSRPNVNFDDTIYGASVNINLPLF
ncbi:hypothetical protein IQ260_00200 [Leptolyngbya cf. ectocarpi LEGE 11479]|uniref:DUF481 domain-containing protein n=1 Tax=Leptolyngbya cf. ectocarpi LEGE 11479 TaxID=1828722 RepID=A0A928WZD2_LEPEC|nr:hypothetical protein [Leptolyngbya ectocarpi]MBE9065075.1 hypothetical protein [Leptolyngbya cf. ectocarpi LEGE 11479]